MDLDLSQGHLIRGAKSLNYQNIYSKSNKQYLSKRIRQELQNSVIL